MKLLKDHKGETKIVSMGVGLILLIVLGYIMFPVISGVQNSIRTGYVDENSSRLSIALNAALGNYTNGVSGALTLFGVSPIVYAAAIVLVILTVYLARQ
jgi:hypothetical protein